MLNKCLMNKWIKPEQALLCRLCSQGPVGSGFGRDGILISSRKFKNLRHLKAARLSSLPSAVGFLKGKGW
jgi:hypothetical protein